MGKLIHFESRRNALPQADDMQPVNLTIEGPLAKRIRHDAAMFGKSPETFLFDWLKSGFPAECPF